MRKRRCKAQMQQLERQIYDALAQDYPQSVRHVFYLMTNPRLPEPVDKTDQGYQQVQKRVADMRLRGDFPFGWITDSSRRAHTQRPLRVQAIFSADMRRSIALICGKIIAAIT